MKKATASNEVTGHSEVSRIVQHLDMLLELKGREDSESRKQQLNIRLDVVSHQLLERLSERLDESRSSLAAHLLSAAVFDACNQLGVSTDYETPAL